MTELQKFDYGKESSDIRFGYGKIQFPPGFSKVTAPAKPPTFDESYNFDRIDSYVDTSVRPYNPEIDLANLVETPIDVKMEAQPTVVLDVTDKEIPQSHLRAILAEKYPESKYPDIHKIILEGLILTRFFTQERLPIAIMSGTDRDYSSHTAYQGETSEDTIIAANGLNRQNVTYLAQQRTSNRSLDGGESTFNFGGLYGNVMLVYDPRYVQKLGSTSSGLSYFPGNPSDALLAIVRGPQR